MTTAVRAVLFDLDDTLVDHRQAVADGLRRYCAELGRPGDDAALARWRAAEERHFRRYLDGELTLQEQRRERVREWLDRSVDDAAADAWFAGFTAHFEGSWRAAAGAAATLAALAGAGIVLGVVTNMESGHQRRKLRVTGLDGHIGTVVGVDVAGAAKPDPRPFLHACDALGVAAGESAFVGDRLGDDAVGARDAGLRAFWLHPEGADPAGLPPGVEVLRRLGDLLPALGLPALEAGPPIR